MSGAVEAEVSRARPLSGGLWTLFSWLRRDEHSSTESVSSAGSDRTALSFAFLPPARCGAAEPARLPPPAPPSDSYRRRVHERNLRRQRDRDLTLHRKYGLYGLGFDTGSLRPEPATRDRRAASESPRAHVPGKRRAPPPPAPAAVTLPRRRARKRPAPPPPFAVPPPAAVEAPPMSRLPISDERPRAREDTSGCKPEKYSKRDARSIETKEVKLRSEKSFLKQIFENKKRNSAIDTSTVKLLPNISELDKQAAEMIEKYRLKEMPPRDIVEKDGTNDPTGSSRRLTEAWICTRCLKKYDSSVITCNYCLPLNKLNDSHKGLKISDGTQTKGGLIGAPGNSGGNIEDKERLKEMLKEMKDSLPKRPKSELITVNRTKNTREIEGKEDYPKVVEAATLRIGSSGCLDKKLEATSSTSKAVPEQTTSRATPPNKNTPNDSKLETINSVLITKPIVLVHTKENVVLNEDKFNMGSRDHLPIKNDASKPLKSGVNSIYNENLNPTNDPKPLNVISKTKYDLNTPLKISSLLNPIYIPKTTATANTQTQFVKQEVKHTNKEKLTTSEAQQNTEEIIRNLIVPQTQIKSSVAKTGKDNKLLTETKQKVQNKVLPLNETTPQDSSNDTKNKNTEVKNVITETKVLTVNETLQGTSNNIKYKNIELKQNEQTAAPSRSVVEPTTSKEDRLDQHARRRDLINQLERSIAIGDEQAAADAAVKLAQLKLSCSVLSFSSQIVGEAPGCSTSTPHASDVSTSKDDSRKNEIKKEDAPEKSSQTNMPKLEAIPEKNAPKNKLKENIDKLNTKLPVTMVTETQEQSRKPNESILLKVETANQTMVTSIKKETVPNNPAPCEPSTSNGNVPKKEEERSNEEEIPILIWVEDKEATRGPVQLHVRSGATLGELRRQAERALGLATRLQRWIVGRALCADDAAPLHTLAGPDLAAPFYLCLVESDTKTTQSPRAELEVENDPGNVYNELVKLEKQALVPNAESFECGVCTEVCAAGGGAVLRECVHVFCRECLAGAVRHSEEPAVACPAPACRGFLQEREIRALVSPRDYDKWLARGLAAAESGSRNAFHCRTRDCTGWAMCDPGVRRFPCPVCKHTNCVPCQAIHEGETCEQHRAKHEESAASQTDEGTRALLNSLISRGEALECPECSAIITKKWGCDWIKCSACKTEICWVTRGRRWGPAGRGDTSAGCRCGVDGKRCHPSCGYCH